MRIESGLFSRCMLACLLGPVVAHAYDVVPPVLTKFNLSGSVNLQSSTQFVNVTLGATDNSTGVLQFNVSLVSPSGAQVVSFVKYLPAPTAQFETTVTVGTGQYSTPNFDRFMEPGVWKLHSVGFMDLDGNNSSYDEAQARAFGNTSFSVTNVPGADDTPPVVVSGFIDTPEVRLSTPPKGMSSDRTPFVSVTLKARDGSSLPFSGVLSGSLTLCRVEAPLGSCIGLQGTEPFAGQPSSTLIVGTELDRNLQPGVYEITSLTLTDAAGNSMTLASGSFDFGTIFPTTSITVDP